MVMTLKCKYVIWERGNRAHFPHENVCVEARMYILSHKRAFTYTNKPTYTQVQSRALHVSHCASYN